MVDRYIAECWACGWQSQAADLAEVAAELGTAHVERAHAAVPEATRIDYIRVWHFLKVPKEEPEPEPEPKPKPEPETHTRREHPAREHTSTHKRVKEPERRGK